MNTKPGPPHHGDSQEGHHEGHRGHTGHDTTPDDRPAAQQGNAGHGTAPHKPAGHGGHSGHDGHAGHGPAPHRPAAYDRHEGHTVAMFRNKFWLTLLLTLPTLIWSPMIQRWFGYAAPRFPGSTYVPAIFGTLVYVYGGRPFLQGGWRELRARLPGMMTLISLAITVAFLYSAAVTIGLVGGMDLWWELATLVAIMLLGHWVEMRSVTQAQGALKELARLLPDTAIRLDEAGGTREVGVEDLRRGDILLVRPGASIPADGVVKEGASEVDESMVTGESRPVAKATGQKVIAGTVNGQGSLRIEVTGTGDETALAGIMRLVEQAQTSRSRTQTLADRAAFMLTIIAVVAAVLTSVTWFALGQAWAFTMERVVTVLVIACPHALGLAIPLVVAISTTLAARHGLLIRDRRGLESARDVDVVCFDKTGTLTRGEYRVVEMTTREGLAQEEALALAAAAEFDSEHAIAQGIVKTAAERRITVPKAERFEAVSGYGVDAIVGGRHIQLGGPALLQRLGVAPEAALRAAIDRASSRGQTAVTMLEGTAAVAVFAVADAVREESREAVRRLREQGIEVIMITGDAGPVAAAVAEELGITTVFAEVKPGEKASKIEEVKRMGKRVAMVGDGINDAPALATADVGIAIGAGTDVAVEAGDIVLVKSNPLDVPAIIGLSKATYRKMMQNLWWAAGYNIVAIPLAAGVLAGWGIVLHPAVGAVLMSVSTIIVALNAQLLRRVRL